MNNEELEKIIEKENETKFEKIITYRHQGSYKNYDYIIKRHNGNLFLCGYVKHKNTHTFILEHLDIHNEISYNEDDTIGFSCNNPYDIRDKYTTDDDTRTYKDFEYVENECKSIIDQIIDLGKKNILDVRQDTLIKHFGGYQDYVQELQDFILKFSKYFNKKDMSEYEKCFLENYSIGGWTFLRYSKQNQKTRKG